MGIWWAFGKSIDTLKNGLLRDGSNSEEVFLPFVEDSNQVNCILYCTTHAMNALAGDLWKQRATASESENLEYYGWRRSILFQEEVKFLKIHEQQNARMENDNEILRFIIACQIIWYTPVPPLHPLTKYKSDRNI